MLDLVSASSASTSAEGTTIGEFILYTFISLALGAAIATVFRYKNKVSKGFSITLAMLPAIVQVVIMLVNGNLGTGVAVMGAFSLVRFRSVPGNARDICSIFSGNGGRSCNGNRLCTYRCDLYGNTLCGKPCILLPSDRKKRTGKNN